MLERLESKAESFSLISPHQLVHAVFEAVDGQLEHGEDFFYFYEGFRHPCQFLFPFLGVKPDGMGVFFFKSFEPGDAVSRSRRPAALGAVFQLVDGHVRVA